MAKIHITDRTTGETVASVPVSVHSPSPDELFDHAWTAAVEQGSVDPARRLDYSFVVEDEAMPT